MAVVAAGGPARPRSADKDKVPTEIQRDQWDRPKIRQPDGSELGYTRASTLGGVLEDQTGITKWLLRLLAWGLSRRRDLIMAVSALIGVEDKADKAKLTEVVEKALDTAGRNAKAEIGTALHALTEQVDRGEAIPDIGEDRHVLAAYREVMARFRVVASEVFVAHDGLQAAGTFDRIVELLVPMQPTDRKGNPVGDVLPAGTLLVLDIKTSGTSDYFGIKFCVQQAVYQGGRVYDPATGERTEHGAHAGWALILHMPSGGSAAELYWVDLAAGRELAELSVTVREARKRKGLIVPAVLPPAPVVEAPAAPVAPAAAFVDPDMPRPALGPGLQQDHARRVLLDLIGRQSNEAAIRDLYLTNQRVWTEAHNVAVRARLAALGITPAPKVGASA